MDGSAMTTGLRHLVERAVVHEDVPVPIDPRLRMGAWIGTGLLAAYASFLWFGWAWFSPARGGTGIPGASAVVDLCLGFGGWGPVVFRATIAVLVGTAALAAATGGFVRARLPGHWCVYAIHVLGFLAGLPLLVSVLAVVIVVAFYVAVGLLIAAVVIGVLVAVIGS